MKKQKRTKIGQTKNVEIHSRKEQSQSPDEKKRKEAAAEIVKKLMKKKNEERPVPKTMEEVGVIVNILQDYGAEEVYYETKYHVELAATIHLLDHLWEKGANAALKLVQDFFIPEGKNFEIPEMKDATFSPALLEHASYIVANRKEETKQEYAALLREADPRLSRNALAAFDTKCIDYLSRLESSIFQANIRLAKIGELESAEETSQVHPLLSAVANVPPELISVAKKMEEAIKREHRITENILMGFPEDQRLPEAEKVRLYGKEWTDLIQGFHVEDPFEFCYGYILAKDQGKSLFTIPTCVIAVLLNAAFRLPWNGAETRCAINDASMPNYEPEMETDPRFADAGRKDNYAQQLYAHTKILYPRGNIPKIALNDVAASYGMAGIAAVVERTNSRGGWMLNAEKEQEEDENEGQKDTIEDIKKLYIQKKEDFKRVKSLLAESKQQLRAAEKEMETLLQELQKQKTELAYLRETVYNLSQNETECEDNAADKEKIAFPYDFGTKKIVVLGGHETWLKQIKPLIPGVRFLSKDQIPRRESFVNCDVIWIQSNAIPHSFFNKILDTARVSGIPCRYFSGASAMKNAIQMVETESRNADV